VQPNTTRQKKRVQTQPNMMRQRRDTDPTQYDEAEEEGRRPNPTQNEGEARGRKPNDSKAKPTTTSRIQRERIDDDEDERDPTQCDEKEDGKCNPT